MQRRRKVAARYRNKRRTRLTTVSGKPPSSEICAVRFYWAASRRRSHNTLDTLDTLDTQTQKISIRCCPRRANPTLAMAELTLGILITSWVRWLYLGRMLPEGDDQPPR